MLVVAAHPESPYTSNRSDCRFPTCYDPSDRDALFQRARSLIDPALERGEHILLVGDLNVTQWEPGYRDLARNLQDAHRQAGWGLGVTWGIYSFGPHSSANRQSNAILQLLRIDYMFSSPQVTPLATSTDCSQRGSDHCILYGTSAVE
ncbi:MAG: endonuclease/exonuclease/phosphatase family protein [Chloroflexales bacterium]|nr:endonuclease/exonuclease/phosphatase family protein [Chloroflexales bacterium]